MRTAPARNRYRPYAINFTVRFTVRVTFRFTVRVPIRVAFGGSGRGAGGYLTTVIRFAVGTGYGVVAEELAVR
ncbi:MULTISPECIES: hypothetical protein [unclassified Streptomyces]|uniref:hypothetical protein n=1 Tax=unclassified Streptomyces TaxID=2593676 RepID=UPI0022545809|nr:MULTISPECIES: hypothetical protein [unclassified Streptomyces]MCX4990019.1 hypothetical protein [Streptomyces sp. NBC_00568]MCX5004751.1 hypothetical protein [Streptomyces sp. NBC_00638]